MSSGSLLEQVPTQSCRAGIFLPERNRRGRQHTRPSIDGWGVADVMPDWGIGPKAVCGGAGASAGLRVDVDQPCIARCHTPVSDEEDRLDETFAAESGNWPRCQITPLPQSSSLPSLRILGEGRERMGARYGLPGAELE